MVLGQRMAGATPQINLWLSLRHPVGPTADTVKVIHMGKVILGSRPEGRKLGAAPHTSWAGSQRLTREIKASSPIRQRAGRACSGALASGCHSSSGGDENPQAPQRSVQPEEGELKVTTSRPGQGRMCVCVWKTKNRRH